MQYAKVNGAGYEPSQPGRRISADWDRLSDHPVRGEMDWGQRPCDPPGPPGGLTLAVPRHTHQVGHWSPGGLVWNGYHSHERAVLSAMGR